MVGDYRRRDFFAIKGFSNKNEIEAWRLRYFPSDVKIVKKVSEHRFNFFRTMGIKLSVLLKTFIIGKKYYFWRLFVFLTNCFSFNVVPFLIWFGGFRRRDFLQMFFPIKGFPNKNEIEVWRLFFCEIVPLVVKISKKVYAPRFNFYSD